MLGLIEYSSRDGLLAAAFESSFVLWMLGPLMIETVIEDVIAGMSSCGFEDS